MSPLLAGLVGSASVVVVALIGWFGGRRLQTATAEKTTGEGWDLLTKGMAARLTALEAENQDLRKRLADAEDEIRALKSQQHIEKPETAP